MDGCVSGGWLAGGRLRGSLEGGASGSVGGLGVNGACGDRCVSGGPGERPRWLCGGLDEDGAVG